MLVPVIHLLFAVVSADSPVQPFKPPVDDNRRQRHQQRPLNHISGIKSAEADNNRRAERIRADG